jgi:hypothetical protein
LHTHCIPDDQAPASLSAHAANHTRTIFAPTFGLCFQGASPSSDDHIRAVLVAARIKSALRHG